METPDTHWGVRWCERSTATPCQGNGMLPSRPPPCSSVRRD